MNSLNPRRHPSFNPSSNFCHDSPVYTQQNVRAPACPRGRRGIMFRDVVMVLSGGAVSYLWLCVIASPLASSFRSLIRHGADRTAWAAFALAAGGAVLWTA